MCTQKDKRAWPRQKTWEEAPTIIKMRCLLVTRACNHHSIKQQLPSFIRKKFLMIVHQGVISPEGWFLLKLMILKMCQHSIPRHQSFLESLQDAWILATSNLWWRQICMSWISHRSQVSREFYLSKDLLRLNLKEIQRPKFTLVMFPNLFLRRINQWSNHRSL